MDGAVVEVCSRAVLLCGPGERWENFSTHGQHGTSLQPLMGCIQRRLKLFNNKSYFHTKKYTYAVALFGTQSKKQDGCNILLQSC